MVLRNNNLLCLLLLFYGDYVYGERERCEVRARIESGWICGKRRVADGGVEYASFRGVPYARQPVGRLRFQELRPATPWNYDFDATEEGPVCPQHDEAFGRLIKPIHGMSEACIYANIHVPIVKTEYDVKGSQYTRDDVRKDIYSQSRGGDYQKEERSLPILVYSHGGGFQAGSGDSDLNGPEYLVHRNVIVITFNYRINVFGFLYLNSPLVPGNQALRDHVTLLRWVQRNARAFGGDPDNVTLMGQSAGAANAHLLSLSRVSVGLFKRVILASGTGNPGFYTTSPLFAKALAALFLSELGINSTDSVEIHEQLVNTPLKRIMLANSNVQFKAGLISFGPVEEETQFPGVTRILDVDPLELIKRGRGNQYPLMIGFATTECGVFIPRLEYLDFKSRVEANPTLLLSPRIAFRTPPTVSLQLAKQVMRKYFKREFTYDEYERTCTDAFFQYPAFQLANLRAGEGAPVFLYQFSYESQLNFLQKSFWINYNGTNHAEDLVRIFKPNAFMETIGVKQLPSRDEQIKDWMTMFVVNFMRCSNPTCSAKTRQSGWPAVRPETFNYQDIEAPGEYRNTGPTQDQWDMIEFYEYIERQSRRAVSAQGPLIEGTNSTIAFLESVSEQFNVQRPRFPFGVVYRPRDSPKMRFKKIQGVGHH